MLVRCPNLLDTLQTADCIPAYQSLATVFDLLLTNSDFRIFLGDMGTIARQVLSDAASSFSDFSRQASKEIEPSQEQLIDVQETRPEDPPTADDLNDGAKQAKRFLEDGVAKTGQDTLSSLRENVSGEQRATLLERLKRAVIKLRNKPDYSDSVSTIGVLIRRYAAAYSRAVDKSIDAAQDSIEINPELQGAIKAFWQLLSSFGDKTQWVHLEQDLKSLLEHAGTDVEFEKLMGDVSNIVESLLGNPDFYDSADKAFEKLRERIASLKSESSVPKDLDNTLQHAQKAFRSLFDDPHVAALKHTTGNIVSLLSPENRIVNKDLLEDLIQVFIPLFIQAIQYIPIPRIEVSVPEMDLLLENLVLEPGATVNQTSFLPFRFLAKAQNDLEIRKAHTHRTVASTKNTITIAVHGLSIKGEEIGFWLRSRFGLLSLADEGIASFELDERGLDIELDVEVGKDRLEKILSLKKVRVHVHKLNYQLRKSKFSLLTWLLKPLLRPILRKVMEKQLATAIADGLHAANRELLYARERLRATRISDPQDLRTFVRAIITRLTPEEDPDLYTAVGVRPSSERFKGVYAPGSVVKVWEEEARRARLMVKESEIDHSGWRSDIFDVHTVG